MFRSRGAVPGRGGGTRGQPRDASPQNRAERLGGQAARRDESRVARLWDHTHMVEGVSRLDEGALREAGFHGVRELGGLDLRAGVQGTALQREMVIRRRACIREELARSLPVGSYRCG